MWASPWGQRAECWPTVNSSYWWGPLEQARLAPLARWFRTWSPKLLNLTRQMLLWKWLSANLGVQFVIPRSSNIGPTYSISQITLNGGSPYSKKGYPKSPKDNLPPTYPIPISVSMAFWPWPCLDHRYNKSYIPKLHIFLPTEWTLFFLQKEPTVYLLARISTDSFGRNCDISA